MGLRFLFLVFCFGGGKSVVSSFVIILVRWFFCMMEIRGGSSSAGVCLCAGGWFLSIEFLDWEIPLCFCFWAGGEAEKRCISFVVFFANVSL